MKFCGKIISMFNMFNYLLINLTIFLFCPQIKSQEGSNDFEAELRTLEEKSQEIENNQMNTVLKLDSVEVGDGMIQDSVTEKKSALEKSVNVFLPDQISKEIPNPKEVKSIQKTRRIPSR